MSKNCVYVELCSVFQIKCVIKNIFSYFSSKTYVVGTHKNRLDETVLLSTQNKMFKMMGKKIFTILCWKYFVYRDHYALYFRLKH